MLSLAVVELDLLWALLELLLLLVAFMLWRCLRAALRFLAVRGEAEAEDDDDGSISFKGAERLLDLRVVAAMIE